MDVNLDLCDFYIRASGVPFALRHRNMAEILGNSIGPFVDIDMANSRDSVGSTLRFRVCIDITQPLRRVIQVTGPQDQELSIPLAYERLPNFCYYCGLIGHLVKDCVKGLEIASDHGDISDENLAYGDSLRATHFNHQAKYVAGSSFCSRPQSTGVCVENQTSPQVQSTTAEHVQGNFQKSSEFVNMSETSTEDVIVLLKMEKSYHLRFRP